MTSMADEVDVISTAIWTIKCCSGRYREHAGSGGVVAAEAGLELRELHRRDECEVPPARASVRR
jgi:hypothetical protein